MYLIDLDTTNPYFNLAVDEYLLKNSRDEFLILGSNDTCVVIGKHQSAHRETETRFIHENKIPVIRRISGGGTVFHDNGNLNFTYIINSEAGKQIDFKKYSRPVIDFLRSLGLPVEFAGKSDLKINEMKISGNAEHVYHNRVLHHGTLLYDSDLSLLRNCLRKDTSGYITKAVASNPSTVTNIRPLLTAMAEDPGGIKSFRLLMSDWFTENHLITDRRLLSEHEQKDITLLAGNKYQTWNWNYAYGPEYQFKSSFRFRNEDFSCKFMVKEGIITECGIEGTNELSPLPEKLIGHRHMVDDLKAIIHDENLDDSGFDIFDLF